MIINPATILNSFEKNNKTLPIAEAVMPKDINIKENPNEKIIVLYKTTSLSRSIYLNLFQ